MIDKVKEVLIVVRLQSGDLCLYSAIDEQMRQLGEANIPFEADPLVLVLCRCGGEN